MSVPTHQWAADHGPPRRSRYRCPICRVIFPGPEYFCHGSWWIYDSARPNASDPPHERTAVVRDEGF